MAAKTYLKKTLAVCFITKKLHKLRFTKWTCRYRVQHYISILQTHPQHQSEQQKRHHKFEIWKVNKFRFWNNLTLRLSYNTEGDRNTKHRGEKSNLNGNFNINRVGFFLCSSFALFFISIKTLFCLAYFTL